MDLKQKIEKKRNLIAKHTAELSKLILSCTHDDFTEDSMYYEGGYLDTAYTKYFKRCNICGKTFDYNTRNHSWYG